ncbi:hypothetical protein BJ165DRAFT_1533626 [Panaeolus papilionaceus]|nr:hypothetical protein BJ165DRAFT_1533626 [Panaeolus papilionaceus]
MQSSTNVASDVEPLAPYRLRTKSLVFQALPWITDVPATAQDLGCICLRNAESYGRKLAFFEKKLFGASQTDNELCKLLGVQISVDTESQPIRMSMSTLQKDDIPQSWSTRIAPRVCSVLSAYKLFDVLAHVDDETRQRAETVSRTPCTDSKKARLMPLKYLSNWRDLVLNFKQKHDLLQTGPGVQVLGQGHSVNIMCAFSKFKAQGYYTTIEKNFTVCALHMKYLLMSESDSVEFPSSTEALVDRLVGPQADRSPELQTYVEQFAEFCESTRPSSSDGLTHMTFPLLMALWLSPLSLLSTISLVNHKFNRQTLIAASTSLGNTKPEIIEKTEHVIWQALVHVVHDVLDPSQAMDFIASNIPEELINNSMWDKGCLDWFILDEVIEGKTVETNELLSAQQSLSILQQATNLISTSAYTTASITQQATQPISTSTRPAANTLIVPHQKQITHTKQPSHENTLDPQPVGAAEQASAPVTDVVGQNVDGERYASGRLKRKLNEVQEMEKDQATINNNTQKDRKKVKKKAANTKNAANSIWRGLEEEGGSETPIVVEYIMCFRSATNVKTYDVTPAADVLELYEAPRLNKQEVFTTFDHAGNKVDIMHQFHHEDYYTCTCSFYDRAEAAYVDGKPLHIAQPENSMFVIMTYDEMVNMAPQQLQNLLNEKVVVFTGAPVKDDGFEAATSRAHALHSEISIQDVSYRDPDLQTEDEFSVPFNFKGTPRQLLQCANKAGKILNAIELPLRKSACPINLSTDQIAWDNTIMLPDLKTALNIPFPYGDMAWALVGTADTATYGHVDTEGFCTGAIVETGMKAWGIEQFELDYVRPNNPVQVEIILLQPGDGICFGPNQMHFVIGLDDTVCHGFHFYAGAVLQRTMVGLICTFILHKFITNTYHETSRYVLSCVLFLVYIALFDIRLPPNHVAFEHVPNLDTWKGMSPNQCPEDDPTPRQQQQMVNFDENDIPWPDRYVAIIARGVAITMITAITDCFEFRRQGEIIEDLPIKHLARQMKAISKFKKSAEFVDREGAPHCTSELLNRQLNNVVNWDDRIANYYYLNDDECDLDTTKLAFDREEEFTIERKREISDWISEKKGNDNELDFTNLGYTSFDKRNDLFHKYNSIAKEEEFEQSSKRRCTNAP